MFNKLAVQKALKRSWSLDTNPGWTPDNPSDGLGSITSQLIHDIFGGEILKTRKKKGWHFYNRVDGEYIDFTKSKIDNSSEDKDNRFEDLPSTPDETQNYFEQEDYSTLFMRFIWAYEEVIGLNKYKYRVTA